ncbi:MAG: isoprenylcysteine carboxylmethyltransferase family protein [Flavobacteriales bacterium]|nr:isoprenylcysteine carboxylmethyltransferase family protein [Flavobacteriales bacterium]
MRSRILVLGQFTCIALLLFGGPWAMPWWAWSLFAVGLGVFGWAVASLGGNNFTILPDPREGNTLAVHGIYRYVRHPMYTAVLVCGLAFTLGAPTLLRSLALVTCAVVLVLKVRHEEALLTARHPDYPQRMHGVARLVPGVW